MKEINAPITKSIESEIAKYVSEASSKGGDDGDCLDFLHTTAVCLAMVVDGLLEVKLNEQGQCIFRKADASDVSIKHDGHVVLN